MEKPYHALIENRIYFGGANDVERITGEENIDIVLDLPEESKGCSGSLPNLNWMQILLGDHAVEPESDLFKDAIDAVLSA